MINIAKAEREIREDLFLNTGYKNNISLVDRLHFGYIINVTERSCFSGRVIMAWVYTLWATVGGVNTPLFL